MDPWGETNSLDTAAGHRNRATSSQDRQKNVDKGCEAGQQRTDCIGRQLSCETAGAGLSLATASGNKFQDSFVEKNGKFEPLPDSAEYLNQLETKLHNLQNGKTKRAVPPQREQILSNLLRSESKQILGVLSDTDIDLDREIVRNQIISKIIPKQPVTVGETVQLITSDFLDQSFSSSSQIDSSETMEAAQWSFLLNEIHKNILSTE